MLEAPHIGMTARTAACADFSRDTARVVATPSYDMTLLSDRWTEVHGLPEAVSLAVELTRELTEGHRLFDVSVRAVAVRKLRKDVLFWLPADNRWAWVHLTWATETSPAWPSSEVVETWHEAVKAVTDADRG